MTILNHVGRQHDVFNWYLFLPSAHIGILGANGSIINVRPFNHPRILRATGRTRREDGINYTELLYRSEHFYFPTNTIEQHRVNMPDWRNFFRVLQQTASEGYDLIDGLGFIRGNYDWGTDNQRVGAMLRDSNPDWWNELAANRRRGVNETPRTKSIRRSIICGHPLEWDRNLYVEEDGSLRRGIPWGYGLMGGTGDDDRYFINRIDAVDIWNESGGNGLYGKTIGGLNGGQPLEANNFWFAHPVYFIHHLESAGLIDMSFNPYEGRAISTFWRDTGVSPPVDRPERVNVVRDNPGFSHILVEPTGNQFNFEHPHFTIDTQPGRRFADPIALFNNRNGATSRHVGLDFRGRLREPIISFIYGRVINIGWVDPPTPDPRRGNGRILVIANERGRGIYILAHLHRDTEGNEGNIEAGFHLRGSLIRRGLRIEPGDAVALVGASGETINRENVYPPHLHVEYYDVQYDPTLDVREDNSSYVQVEGTGNTRRLVLQRLLNLAGGNRRNPFDHEERQL